MTGGSDDAGAAARRDEVAAGLAQVRERIDAACAAAGRRVDEVTLVAVTKFFGAADVRTLAGLGVTDVGENRHQEAEEKAAACAEEGLRWHFVGGLQSNKAGQVAAWADVVESVDRTKLVGRLDAGAQRRMEQSAERRMEQSAQRRMEQSAQRRGEPLDCLVQVSLDPPGSGEGRQGAEPDDLLALADRVAAAPSLRLGGLMAVAPVGEDPAAAFERLAVLHDRLLAAHPGATVLSAGMSTDLEQAIAIGATHVRVGRAVLGERPPNQ